MDIEHRSGGRSTPHFTCSDQGVSAGWADVYSAGLDCQWIDISGVPDGDYVLEARTNQSGIVGEDWYGDNVTWAGVRLSGNTASVIPPPCYPEDCLGINPANVQAANVGGSWKVVDGNHWILDFGAKQADAERARDIIKHYGMNHICFVGRPSRSGQQLMMYFKVNNAAPSGVFPGEDAIPFNPNSVFAQAFGGRWKVTDGRMWMLDFGVSEANARKAVWIIKKYGFQYQCFVGRPNAPMMYFRIDGKGKEKEKEKEKERKETLKEKERKEALKEKERDVPAAPGGEQGEMLTQVVRRIEDLERRLGMEPQLTGPEEVAQTDESAADTLQILHQLVQRIENLEGHLATGEAFIRPEERPAVDEVALTTTREPSSEEPEQTSYRAAREQVEESVPETPGEPEEEAYRRARRRRQSP